MTGGALLLMATAAGAQNPNAAGASGAQALEGMIEQQQRLIDEQAQRLEAMQRQLAELRDAVAALRSQPQSQAPGDNERERPEPDIDLPPADVVTEGSFPGSFAIPGANAAIKVGGMVRLNWVTTFNPLLVTDRFPPAEIPVDVENAPVGRRVDVIAIPSRFNLDFRTATGAGYVRAFIEGDFAGSGDTFRLRHAYGQWKRFLFGQTWTTFSDQEADPPGIDFESLSAIIKLRQPQARFTVTPAERLRIVLALENTETSLTGATAISQLPDAMVRFRWQLPRERHLQSSAVLRQVRGTPSSNSADIVSGIGWGVNFSGKVSSPFWRARDLVYFQVNYGAGIGHYINDLNEDGGQDGVFDANANVLRILRAAAGYIGYEHYWSSRFRSVFTGAFVRVPPIAIQAEAAYLSTRRYNGDIIWAPVPRLELVAEFLYGRRVNIDTHSLQASQLQIGATFKF